MLNQNQTMNCNICVTFSIIESSHKLLNYLDLLHQNMKFSNTSIVLYGKEYYIKDIKEIKILVELFLGEPFSS